MLLVRDRRLARVHRRRGGREAVRLVDLLVDCEEIVGVLRAQEDEVVEGSQRPALLRMGLSCSRGR